MICARFVSTNGGSGSTHVGPSYGKTPLSGSNEHYYRITVRVTGPRQTVRYVQEFVVM